MRGMHSYLYKTLQTIIFASNNLALSFLSSFLFLQRSYESIIHFDKPLSWDCKDTGLFTVPINVCIKKAEKR